MANNSEEGQGSQSALMPMMMMMIAYVVSSAIMLTQGYMEISQICFWEDVNI
jgi:hypothetical protein